MKDPGGASLDVRQPTPLLSVDDPEDLREAVAERVQQVRVEDLVGAAVTRVAGCEGWDVVSEEVICSGGEGGR